MHTLKTHRVMVEFQGVIIQEPCFILLLKLYRHQSTRDDDVVIQR